MRASLLLLCTTVLLGAPRALRPGEPVSATLGGGQSHEYLISLQAGDYLEAVVMQKGVDVVVRLFAPNGNRIFEGDSPNGTQGPEPVYGVAGETGGYRLEVAALDPKAPAGAYQVRIELIRAATASDRLRVEGERTYAEAMALVANRDERSRQNMLERLHQAQALFDQAGARLRLAQALRREGSFLLAAQQFEKALDPLERALKLSRETGDIREESVAANELGVAEADLGRRQEAARHLETALELSRRLGDEYSQLVRLINLGSLYRKLLKIDKAFSYGSEAVAIAHKLGDRNRRRVSSILRHPA